MKTLSLRICPRPRLRCLKTVLVVLRPLIMLLLAIAPSAVQAQFAYVTNNGTITITGYTGPGGEVEIPNMVDSLPVRSIGTLAFRLCASLTSVRIPDTVIAIESGAFAFCSSLTNVSIADGLEEIGPTAFYACSSLMNINLPRSVTQIGERTFEYCAGLTAVTVDPLNPVYSSVKGVLFDKGQTKLVVFPEGQAVPYIFPGNVRSIGDCAFTGNSKLTTITIPNSVTNIGYDAFYDCRYLTNVTIGSGVISIGSRALYCDGLKNISADPANPAYTSAEGVLFDKGQSTLVAYPNGKGQNYVIPGGVTTIGDYAFYSCTSLTNVSIPNSVSSIGNGAFYSCTALANLSIPNKITSVGHEAFYYCTSLTDVTLPEGVTNIGVGAFGYCRSLTSFNVPQGLTLMSAAMFSNCSGLTNATIPDSVTYLDGGAFAYCTSLTRVLFEGNAPSVWYNSFSGATNAIVYYVAGTTGWGSTFAERPTALWVPFEYASNKDGVTITRYTGHSRVATIPPAINGLPVTAIGFRAFDGCTNLQCISIAVSVATIGEMAFFGCVNLTNAIIPEGVSSIAGWAFFGCTSLSAVTIPNTVTSIGNQAFYNCTSLTTVTIPGSVTTILDSAFFGCASLTAVYFEGNAPAATWPVGFEPFGGCSKSTMYYLAGTTGWESTFAGRPTALWGPPSLSILINDVSFGVRNDMFGFRFSGPTSALVVVEACTNLANATWAPLRTNTLNSGSSYFTDPDWWKYSNRVYRLRTQQRVRNPLTPIQRN